VASGQHCRHVYEDPPHFASWLTAAERQRRRPRPPPHPPPAPRRRARPSRKLDKVEVSEPEQRREQAAAPATASKIVISRDDLLRFGDGNLIRSDAPPARRHARRAPRVAAARSACAAWAAASRSCWSTASAWRRASQIDQIAARPDRAHRDPARAHRRDRCARGGRHHQHHPARAAGAEAARAARQRWAPTMASRKLQAGLDAQRQPSARRPALQRSPWWPTSQRRFDDIDSRHHAPSTPRAEPCSRQTAASRAAAWTAASSLNTNGAPAVAPGRGRIS
jgi:hypothetical protein